MPPPIEEEEEVEEEDLNHHDAPAFSTHHQILDTEKPKQAESGEDIYGGPQNPEFGQREPSPVLVVSDILTKKVAPARTPLPSSKVSVSARQHVDKGKTAGTTHGTKRTTSPLKSNHGPPAKRQKGDIRAVPCAYCVRRLANDPAWACHDASVALNGVGSYTGHRCKECVKAHVSCQLIPPKADKPVQALLKAAADLVASPGALRGPLLAAYEATTGPALRAIGIVPGPRGLEKSEPASKKPSIARSKPSSSRAPTRTTARPRNTTSRRSFSSAGPADRSNAAQSQQQGGQTTATTVQPLHRLQEDDGADHHFEKLERQALRRRKVEALESLAHTAALFLAEFMTFTKGGSSRPPATARPAAGEQEEFVPSRGPQDPGMDYAASAVAMAASMFRPLTATAWSARASAEEQPNGAKLHGSESDSSRDSSVDNVLGTSRSARDYDGNEHHGYQEDVHNDTEVEEDISGSNMDDREEEDDDEGEDVPAATDVPGQHREDESEERDLQQRDVKSEDS